jgi:S-DNA-T family DNA segregation ATPase FtsK/SpoIIIE
MEVTINPLYHDLITENNHILIAGATRSGKSVLIDELILAALCKGNSYFIMIDPKRVDLRKYRKLNNLIERVTDTQEAIRVLNDVIDVMEKRYKEMEANDQVKTTRPRIYVIIDEVADLILTNGKEITPLLQRIAALGAAAGISLVMATQTVLATILSTPIKNNFDCIIGLRTATANQSRVIIGENGTERLPRHGAGIIRTPQEIRRYKLPMTDPAILQEVIKIMSK